MGDKGDGTPCGKAEAGRRHAHLNDGHIPDMYRVGPPHILYEWKCYTPFKTRVDKYSQEARCIMYNTYYRIIRYNTTCIITEVQYRTELTTPNLGRGPAHSHVAARRTPAAAG